jgi:capsid portal protein
VKRCTSDNTAFTKLAKMNVVRTLRECPERYLKPMGKHYESRNFVCVLGERLYEMFRLDGS